VNTPFFGVIYFYAQWIFISMCIIGMVVSAIKSRKNRNILFTEDMNEDDEEQQHLISNEE